MDFNISIRETNENKRKILHAVVVSGIILTVLSLFGPNPLLCLAAFISLYFIIDTLFISKYLLGFLVAFIYQWSQVSIKVIYACVTFRNVHDLTTYPDNFILCYLLSSIGLVLITYAISRFLRQIEFEEDQIIKVLKSVNVRKLIFTYFAIGIAVLFFPKSLFQITILLAAFKWGVFYLLFIRLYNYRHGKWFIIGLVLFEFIQGISSYFSSWKYVIFYVAISFLSIAKLTTRKILGLALSMIFVVYFGLLWTGVKGDYRNYISQGNKQVILVSKAEAYNKMLDLVLNFKLDNKVSMNFIDRISYIDYFSRCMSYVPSVVPHENGNLTKDAIMHVLVPRFLNPNKKIIDESTHLTKYTGVFFSNLSMGVSFSLGYFGDFYVDYGIIGMLIAILVYGLFIGYVFKDIFSHILNPIIAIAILQMSFSLLFKFEMSLIKMTGGIVLFWILYRLLAILVFPNFSKWLMK